MVKKVLTPFEIRDVVQKLVNKIPKILAKEDYVTVPIPFWQKPDEQDCNWNVDVSNVANYARPVRAVIEKIRMRVNLQDRRQIKNAITGLLRLPYPRALSTAIEKTLRHVIPSRTSQHKRENVFSSHSFSVRIFHMK